MKIEDIKKILYDIVHNSLFVSSTPSSEDKEKLDEIYNYFIDNRNAIDDLRTILSLRNNDTKDAYDKYIRNILINVNTDIKLDILNNQTNYEDIIKNNNIYIDIWLSLTIDERISYLKNKKKFTELDIVLINEGLKENNNFNENKLLIEIISNEKLRSKIDNYSIVLSYNYSLLLNINLNDINVCKILSKNTYTKLLLKKINNFDDFLDIYNNNKGIYDLIDQNSLLFDSNDNEKIYDFIIDNPNFIGKFNEKYIDLFSIIEITKMYNNKNIDSDAFSTLFNKLYKYDSKKLLNDFNENVLSNFSKHSIDVYLFDKISDELRDKIFNNYSLFNRFIDTIMIEAINNHFDENDIVDYLRNDTFINDMSSFAIELLLNKLSFRSAFNMLQRKNILEKINHLNINVDNKDIVFIKGFLDSPSLIIKSDHNMIYNMIKLLNKEDTLYYILLPYIVNCLSNSEIVNLFLEKEISINELINSNELINKLKTTDIINYINCYFKQKLDLSIFKNKKLCKMLFNLSDDDLDNINIDEVNYLYETIRMKSLLSKQEVIPTLINYKSVLASYLTLGLDKTLKFISDGNKDVTLEDVKILQNEVVNERILRFKENNSSVFQNMNKKLIDNLNLYLKTDDINMFLKCIKNNTYIDNLIYLMLDNNYDSYNNIINRFYSYVNYYEFDPFNNQKDIYDYCNNFISLFINNRVKEYNEDFKKVILNNFKPKENIIYNKRKEIGKKYLNKLQLKIFIKALNENDKSKYEAYFRDNYNIDEIKDKYVQYLNCPNIEFENILEHILIPYSNDRFDFENCLNKINIHKPNNYDSYIDYLNNLQNVTKLNMEIEKIKDDFDNEDLIIIMNHICYNSTLSIKVKNKIKNLINDLKGIVANIGNELYVDKVACKFIYSKTLDIYNIDEIIEYKKYNEIIENLIEKTFNYINRNMNKEYIKNEYAHEYFENINSEYYEFPISSKYYELKKRVFSLKDIEVIFNGYEISNYKKANESLNDFLFKNKNLIMIADGYYQDIINNFGLIISKWDDIVSCNEDINNMNLVDIEHSLSVINFKDNVLINSINNDIVNDICENGYYEVLDINKRINMLAQLYENSFKSIKSTIPYLSYKHENVTIKTIDKYDSDIFRTVNNSIFKIGTSGNDLLCYSILNKNGTQIGIYNNNQLIAKIIGVRNGNTLYLNSVDGYLDDSYNNLLRGFANELIKVTNEDIEPINFITIVNNENYNSRNGLRIDSTVCPIISDPISKQYSDYKEFCSYDFLLNPHNMYSNYSDNITTLLASNDVVDKNNFLYYDCEAKYLRKRNSIIKLSNNVGEEYIDKIDSILCLCKKLDNDINIDNIRLSNMNTIFLGDDFVLFVSNKNDIFKYVLPYDDRALKEIDLILESIKD